jgi:hypothetical protein
MHVCMYVRTYVYVYMYVCMYVRMYVHVYVPLGRPKRRWEDNIKMDLQEMGGGCGNWMELARDRDRWRTLVSAVMNFRDP